MEYAMWYQEHLLRMEDVMGKKLEAKIDTARMNVPAFKMVLTGTGDYAYLRRDGIVVVPVGCLRY